MITVNDVLTNPTTTKVPTDKMELFKLTTDLIPVLTTDNCDQIIKFLERVPTEYAVYCLSGARELELKHRQTLNDDEKAKQVLLRQVRSFKDWAKAHVDEVLAKNLGTKESEKAFIAKHQEQ
jgi:hypothetical protein